MSDEVKVYEQSNGLVPSVSLQPKSIAELKNSEKFKKDLVQMMVEGEFATGADYGSVPGIDKMIFDTGISFLIDTFNLGTGKPVLEKEIHPTEINTKDGKVIVDHVEITAQTPILNLLTGQIVAVGIGSCSSLETKYRYRGEFRICPKCQEPQVREAAAEKGGGYYCWKKKGGCGAKFEYNDKEITSQPFGKVENTNPSDVFDTIKAMATKRSINRNILRVTGMAKYFFLDPATDRDKGGEYETSANARTMEKENKRSNVSDPEKHKKKPDPEADSKLSDLIDVFKLEVMDKITEDEAKEWLRNASKNEEKGYKGFSNLKYIKSEAQLGFFKGKFRREFGEPEMKQADLMPEQDIDEVK